MLDSMDATHFSGLSNDPYVQQALWALPTGTNVPLITVIAYGLNQHYNSDGTWPPVSSQWVTLAQAKTLLKWEGMKMAVQRGDPGRYLAEPFTASVRNLLLEGCPSAWKPYLIPVVMTAQGLTISDMIEKLGQLGELPGLEKPDGPPQLGTPKMKRGKEGSRVNVLICSANYSRRVSRKRTLMGNRLVCCVVWLKRRGVGFEV